MHPAIGQGRGALLGLVPVTEHGAGTANPDFPGRSVRHRLARLVEDAELDAIGGAARRLAPRVSDGERLAIIGQHRSGRHRLGLTEALDQANARQRSEEHTSELQSLMRISYAVFCLKKKNNNNTTT